MFASRLATSLAAAAGSLTLLIPAAAASGSVPLPNSMASTGDSMTRAFDVDSACTAQDCPQYSWSTGYDSAVNSQYQRILAANPGIANHEYNDAVSGAKMNLLDSQALAAASQGVQYLTVEMGANDVCASSTSNMTPTSTYQAEFQQALTDFTKADPNAHISVASIPNVIELWQLEHNNPNAVATWNVTHFCSNILLGTDGDRQAASRQLQADNQALATVCAQFPQCRFDNDAVYNYQFSTADVSTVDYFHPSLTGQNDLASVTWGAGYWPNTR